MRKFRLIVLILIPLLGLALFALTWSALHSESGARWLVGNIQGRLGDTLHIAEVQGDLASGLTIKRLTYRDPSLEVRAQRIFVVVDLDLFPPLVQIHRSEVDQLEILQLASSSEPTSLEDALAAMDLPVAIEVASLIVREIGLTAPDGAVVFAADHVDTSFALDEAFRIEQFVLESNGQRIELNGKLGLATPFPLESMADMHFLWTDEAEVRTAINIRSKIAGTIRDQLEVSINADQPAITIDGFLRNLTGLPQWQLNLTSPELSWPPAPSGQAESAIEQLHLISEGWAGDYRVTVTGILHNDAQEPMDFSLNAHGDTAGLGATDLELKGESVDLTASGAISWQDGIELELLTTIHKLLPGTWIEDWPDQHPVRGQVNFSLENSDVAFSGLQLEAAGSAFQLQGGGSISLSEGSLAANVNWQDFAWPPGSGSPGLASSEGSLTISGMMDDWTASGAARVEAPGLPKGRLQVEATGNREQAAVKIIEGSVLGGVISGDAEVTWQNRLQWTANLASSGIEVGRILPDWPARINTELSTSGSTNPLEATITIHQLHGEFKSMPISARGRLDYRDGVPDFEGFNLTLGGSSAELNGQLYSSEGLMFKASVEDLSSLLAQSRGRVQATGRLSLQPGAPRLELDLAAGELVWGDFRAESLSIQNSPDSSATSFADLDVRANRVRAMDFMLDTVELDIKTSPENQAIRLKAVSSNLDLSAQMSGQIQDSGDGLFAAGWAGELSALTLTESSRLALALQNPAPLSWSMSSAKIEAACLATDAASTLCAEGEWIQDERLTANVSLSRVPLSLAQPFLDTELEMTQTIDGELVWDSTADKPASGNAQFRLSPGEIRYPDDFDSLLKTGEGLISFNLASGKLSEGRFDLPLPGMGNIDFDLNIPDVAEGVDATVDGHLKVTVADLDVITLFMTGIDRAGGEFSADVDLIGSIGEPHFSGELTLTDGLIRHHNSGLRLDDIDLAGRIKGNDKATLTGSFKALEGIGQIEARLDVTELLSPRLELELTGENLKLFDAKDLTLIATPDVRVGWQPGLLEIDGSILIPSARIAPTSIPASTVSESPDLVIVAGAPKAPEQEEKEGPPLNIRGNLKVTLGDEVNVVLDLARAELTGSAVFSWRDELIPVANGQYSLVGQINALGQRLEISQGTIGFPDVPANNPHLNVRAERQIYGNSEIRRAGVFVSGTLRRFTMEPYTEPATNRERARTLLITGSDFNMEEGSGAVDIGTYIAPRIFVSYGVGVFSDENVVSIRYDLGRGWGVKATSGQKQTGVDLSYTIER